MAIRYYDDAIVAKIQSWIKDDKMVVLKPNEVNRLFQIRADQFDDKPLTLPLIAVSRDPSVTLDIPTRRSLSADGAHQNQYTIQCDNCKSDFTPTQVGWNNCPHCNHNVYIESLPKAGTLQLNAIPAAISYQIDIYTRRYEEGDEYLRNFVFNFINHPKMSIFIPYNDSQIEHICYTRLDNTLTDNSDVAEKLFADEFTRWSLKISIHDAFFFSAPVKDNGEVVAAELDLVSTNPKYEEKEAIDLAKKHA